MTYKEAADRIEEHMRIHYNNEYPYAIKITEALELAVNVLQKLALTEECVIKKGRLFGTLILKVDTLNAGSFSVYSIKTRK